MVTPYSGLYPAVVSTSAYFGTYTVDYERSTWITHVLGTNIPAYLNADQPRTFKLKGDTLNHL
jgi:hypothetical protein